MTEAGFLSRKAGYIFQIRYNNGVFWVNFVRLKDVGSRPHGEVLGDAERRYEAGMSSWVVNGK